MEISNVENKGLSLIELVVVVCVLSILSSIALSLFNIFKERAADTLVKVSMLNTFKECKTSIFLEEEIPTFTLDLGLNSTNGYYQFYQEYDYEPRDDGTIPSTILGNCIGPLGPHRIGVKKVKGINKKGELWINLDTGEKIEKGGLSWN
tara:strand:- start:215 stop:661 length:447 start_codon:yes stop_codon:yes gene_type:complete